MRGQAIFASIVILEAVYLVISLPRLSDGKTLFNTRENGDIAITPHDFRLGAGAL